MIQCVEVDLMTKIFKNMSTKAYLCFIFYAFKLFGNTFAMGNLTWFDPLLITTIVKLVFLFRVIDCYIWLNQVTIIWNKMKWEWGKSPFVVSFFLFFFLGWLIFVLFCFSASTRFIHILATITINVNANHLENFVLYNTYH